MQDHRFAERPPDLPPHEIPLVPLDSRQVVSPAMQIAYNEELTRLAEYHAKAHTHLWLVLITHQATNTMLDNMDGVHEDLPLLDAETMVGRPAVLCWNCEAPYSPRDRHRKCKPVPA